MLRKILASSNNKEDETTFHAIWKIEAIHVYRTSRENVKQKESHVVSFKSFMASFYHSTQKQDHQAKLKAAGQTLKS